MRQVLPYSTRLCFQNGFEKIYCFCFLFHTLFFNILLLLKVLTLERYSEKQKFKSKFYKIQTLKGTLVFLDLTKFASFLIYHSLTEHSDKIFTMLCLFGIFVKHFTRLYSILYTIAYKGLQCSIFNFVQYIV